MNSASNIRYGDSRHKQSKIQKQRQSEMGSGRRRGDPSVHATSRPWHTSTPGIKMNITTLGQIAARDKVAAKYLNRMTLSEMAQKKRGIDAKEEGKGYDKMGLAMKRGLQHAQGRGRMPGPNQDTINRMRDDLMGRTRDIQAKIAQDPGEQLALYNRQLAAIQGMKRKLRNSKFGVSNFDIHRYQY